MQPHSSILQHVRLDHARRVIVRCSCGHSPTVKEIDAVPKHSLDEGDAVQHAFDCPACRKNGLIVYSRGTVYLTEAETRCMLAARSGPMVAPIPVGPRVTPAVVKQAPSAVSSADVVTRYKSASVNGRVRHVGIEKLVNDTYVVVVALCRVGENPKSWSPRRRPVDSLGAAMRAADEIFELVEAGVEAQRRRGLPDMTALQQRRTA